MKRTRRAAEHEPEEAHADAPRDGRRQVVADGTGQRPATGRAARAAVDGVGTVLVAPMSRRTNASTPMTSRTTTTTASKATDGQSNCPASGRWFCVQPNQVRLANGASSGTGCLVAVEEEAGEHHEAGDAGRRATADERGQGERERRRRPAP